MLVLVFLAAIVAILGGAAVVALGRGRQFNDVERFHRARGITTGWARAGMTRPVIGEQREHSGTQRERSDAPAHRG